MSALSPILLHGKCLANCGTFWVICIHLHNGYRTILFASQSTESVGRTRNPLRLLSKPGKKWQETALPWQQSLQQQPPTHPFTHPRSYAANKNNDTTHQH